jgi:hypothetical protein
MMFCQIIFAAQNATGEPKLGVLFATVVSVYNGTVACIAV